MITCGNEDDLFVQLVCDRHVLLMHFYLNKKILCKELDLESLPLVNDEYIFYVDNF